MLTKFSTIRKIMINIVIMLLHYWNILWEYIFDKIGNIYLVYYITDKNTSHKKNISFNFYTGYNLNQYKNGTYYVKNINKYGTNHIIFKGDVAEINKIKNIELNIDTPRRKNIILQKDNEPININLEILDNYKQNMIISINPVVNLGEILRILDIPCATITIIKHFPFSRQTIDVSNVNINDIYH